MPQVPGPEELPSEARDQGDGDADDARSGARLLRARAADRAEARSSSTAISCARAEGAEVQRLDPRHRPAAGRPGDPPMRARLRLRHDAARHSALIAHGRTVFERSIQAASLDHALWFHRPFRADDWLLYAQDSPEHLRRPRLLPRPDLRARRHPRRLGRAGRPDPPARGPRLARKPLPNGRGRVGEADRVRASRLRRSPPFRCPRGRSAPCERKFGAASRRLAALGPASHSAYAACARESGGESCARTLNSSFPEACNGAKAEWKAIRDRAQ